MKYAKKRIALEKKEMEMNQDLKELVNSRKKLKQDASLQDDSEEEKGTESDANDNTDEDEETPAEENDTADRNIESNISSPQDSQAFKRKRYSSNSSSDY